MTKADITLTSVSLVTLLLVITHLAGDVVRDMAPGNLTTLGASTGFAVLWLYATLVLTGRRSGYIILILGSAFGFIISMLHMRGAGLSTELLHSDGGFFFVWTLLALGASAAFTFVLAVRGLLEHRP